MKRFYSILIVMLLLVSFSSAFSQLQIKQGDELFIKPSSENLRLSPNGSILCTVPQGTKVIALGEQGNWVAVQIVGYIWKNSLSDSRFNIKGYTLRALHILTHSEEEANEIKKLLDAGGDFKKLAIEKSKGPNAEKGGDLGLITKGDLMPELDQTLSQLKIDEVSKVVKSKMGFHIFKRYE